MRASNRSMSGAASVLAMTSARSNQDDAKRPGNNGGPEIFVLASQPKTFGLACYGADRQSHVKGDAGRQLRAELLDQVTDQFAQWRHSALSVLDTIVDRLMFHVEHNVPKRHHRISQ